MMAVRAILAAAAAAAVVALPTDHPNCVFTPSDSTADKVSYNLEWFADDTHLVYDDRNVDDKFLFQMSFCGDVPMNRLANPHDCKQTRSRVNQSACGAPAYSPSPVYQFFSSGAQPQSDEESKMQKLLAAAREAGVAIPDSAKPISGALKTSILAAAQRGLPATRARVMRSPVMPDEAEVTPAVTTRYDGTPLPPSCNGACWRAAGSSAIPANIKYTPLFRHVLPEHTHYASGLSVEMTGGDNCWDDGTGAGSGTAGVYPRSTRVHLICSPQFGSLDDDALVVEVATCRYEVVLHTVHACPVQCLPDAAEGGVNLCGGNGVCNWDTSSKRARCFCFEGHSGDQCTLEGDLGAPVPTGHPDMIVGALFGGIFGGLLLAGGAFYYMVYVRTPGPARSAAPAAPSSGGIGGIRAMFGGSSGYAPPTPEGGDIPGIDDGTAGYAAPGDDDADNPML